MDTLGMNTVAMNTVAMNTVAMNTGELDGGSGASDQAGAHLPLAGVRVVDLTDGRAEGCARLLGDLGADVIRVEPPGGSASRSAGVIHAGCSLSFAVNNANKRAVELDLDTAAGLTALRRLVLGADILVESRPPGKLAALGCAPEDLWAENPSLVVTSVTDFGQTGPWRDRTAADEVHLALCGMLSQSGLPDLPPLLPPINLVEGTVSAQAAWATMVAYWCALDTGRGDHVDLSVLETLVDTLDPPFGMQGSATSGMKITYHRGRPDGRHRYPIVPCADGYVRLCVLAKGHWRALFALLGQPERFAHPRYDVLVNRYADAAELGALMQEAFAARTRADLVADGQARGLPIEAVRSLDEALDTPQFSHRAAFLDLPLDDGAVATVPDGPLWVEGRRAGVRFPAPAPGGHAGWAAPRRVDPGGITRAGRPGRPLAGLRVLNLGVIVVGAETGRLFADLGADVIKVESRAFPDGIRQAGMYPSVAAGLRNERSVGVNLRDEQGRALFLRLVAVSDVVATNFKPGTLESLGLGADVLRSVNPGVVVIESSGLGHSGPWSRRLGYGPLVRGVTGLSDLWRYPDDPSGFCDAVTVYPDHTGARLGALGALALLADRRRHGRGGSVSLAQSEIVLHQFADRFALASLRTGPTGGPVAAPDAPSGVFPCAGDDEWCVVAVGSDAQWRALARVLGADDLLADPALADAAGRRARREELEACVATWTATRAPKDVNDLLEQAGVPVGVMRRAQDLVQDPHLLARGFFTTQHQPEIGDMVAGRSPAVFAGHPVAPIAAAPLPAADTRQVVRELLDLDDATVDALMAAGALEESVAVVGT
jgi:crotonobetainyl-CoA:carnitine CoA-transferase CaiB-like acyl-CoA transferase